MVMSGWWLVLAFLLGTYAGITLMALLYLSAREEQDDGEQLPEVAGLGP